MKHLNFISTALVQDNATVELILIGDKEIGEMLFRDGRSQPYHAVLEVTRCRLAQGHGTTREEAIRDALQRGQQEAEIFQICLTTLAQHIRGDQQ